MHAPVSSLSPLIQSALRSIGYHRADVEVIPAEKVSPSAGGGDGQKGFLYMINLTNGESKRIDGSWGGANMFNRDNPVDLDTASYALPPNGVVIKGSVGYRGFATVYVPLAAAANFLPLPTTELTQVEKDGLYCHRGIKGGEARREERGRGKAQTAVIVRMFQVGFPMGN